MQPTIQIAILDDDHVIRMTRYALSGPGEITDQWVRDFYAPEEMDPAEVYAVGDGLHESDGVYLIPMSANLDLRRGSDARILIFRRGVIDARLIDANPKLQLIQRIGERADGIDLEAAHSRGVLVSCLPRPTLQYTAEHAILLMLALSKRLVEADAAVRRDCWDRVRVHPQNGVAYNWVGLSNLGGLSGKTIGIIGLGEVGSIVARIADSFGMRILYCNRSQLSAEREVKLNAAYTPLSDLLAQSDFVSLHATDVPENRGLIDGKILQAMKPGAFFVNTSRGRLVDEDALCAALTNGTIAGAGLDVHLEEPRPTPDRLAALPNVILTPHIAGGSRKGVLTEIKGALDNCRALLDGKPIRYGVQTNA
jgi:phosphoglycerate dehydrogenase-like enzyme